MGWKWLWFRPQALRLPVVFVAQPTKERKEWLTAGPESVGTVKDKNEEQVCQNQNQKYLKDPRVEIACITVMFSVVCVRWMHRVFGEWGNWT